MSFVIYFRIDKWTEGMLSMPGKRTHNGCLVQIESPVTQDNYLASLGKPRDAEQLLSWQNC